MVAPLHLPAQVPTWSDITGAAMRPDDGTLFLTTLTVLAWAAWAGFTASALVEAVAQARGLPAVRLPLLSIPQHAAAVLVAAVTVLISPGIPNGPFLGSTSVAAATLPGPPRHSRPTLNSTGHLCRKPAQLSSRSAAPRSPPARPWARHRNRLSPRRRRRRPRVTHRHRPARRHAVGTGRTPPRRRHPVHRDRPPQLRPSPARRRRPHPRALDPPRLDPAAAH